MRKLLALLVLATASCLPAADKKPQLVATDPDKAGPDFAVQGEYVGETGDKAKLAAQVVARGDGKFEVFLLQGGLPGEGWDPKSKKIEAQATTAEGKVTVSGKGNKLTGTIADGKLTGTTEDGKAFTLKHVIRQSKTLGAKPPAGAIILFDGSSADEWEGGKLLNTNLLNTGIKSKKAFKDHKLHIEFFLPYLPFATGQARGNSGVYMQDRYEIQVLDSFGLKGDKNECGAIYDQHAPAVNMCFPPLTWQTYDVDFHAAKFDTEGKKTANATITVVHNGVKILDNVEIKGPTGGGQKETDKPGPIQLQAHGGPMFYRNIWVVETK